MKHKILFGLFVAVCYTGSLRAQDLKPYSLQQLTDSALKNNHILTIKDWAIKEGQAKLKEDEIKKYPSTIVNANYQYNFVLSEITIPAGTIGELPLSSTNTVLLPNTDKSFTVGEHNNYNIGIAAYQPITQQVKIKTGLEVDKLDVLLTEKEKFKISLQIKLGVEKLYYGALIAQKQLEEANAKLDLAKAKYEDAESALAAGKTIAVGKTGLQASIADEEQNVLKLMNQFQDYLNDLQKLTRVSKDSIKLMEIESIVQPAGAVNAYKNTAMASNVDLQMANISKSKALLGIKAAKQSNLPDLGLVAGYAYQRGNPLLPANNPFVGINLKWNLQDLFSNKQIVRQRKFQLKQAEETIANTQEQVNNDIEKAYRKINEANALISVARRAVTYRKEEMKLEEDKQAAGFNVKTDLLNTRSLLARAEADRYAAQLSYLLAVSDLNVLTGQ